MDGKQLHVYYAPNVNVTRCIMARIKETHKHKIGMWRLIVINIQNIEKN